MEIQKFECFCSDGFDGTFCEHKVEADHLLFIRTTVNDFGDQFQDKLVFNESGRLLDESAPIGENSGAYMSCSTMVNGEAVIFGGNLNRPTNMIRQVHFKKSKTLLRYLSSLNVQSNVLETYHSISPKELVEPS